MAVYQNRWWGDGRVCLGDWVFETLSTKPIRASYFINPMSEFPLTYRSELIDKDPVSEARSLLHSLSHMTYALDRPHVPQHWMSPCDVKDGKA